MNYCGRHVGDIGHVEPDAAGNIVTEFRDRLVSLAGTNDVIGRSVIVSSHTHIHTLSKDLRIAAGLLLAGKLHDRLPLTYAITNFLVVFCIVFEI